MQKYYVIQNNKGQYWNSSIFDWTEEATFYTQHGKDTYPLPVGGKWVFAVEM